MVGSALCSSRIYRDSPVEALHLGEDPSDPGGFMILEGRSVTCGSVYTHTPNMPMSMFSQHKDIEVYATVMTRRDPFYGNTYQLVPTITRHNVQLPGRQTLTSYDITIEIVWNQPDMNPKEVGSIKMHLSRVPIYALFNYYGCHNCMEMTNYIFPGVDPSDPRVLFLLEAVTTGKYHRALYDNASPITPNSSLLHIGECILSSDARTRFMTEVSSDVNAVVKDMGLSPEQINSAARQLYEERVMKRTKSILDGTFYFNVNTDPRKVCMSMGSIVAHIINIKMLVENPTDRTNLYYNRIQSIGEQFVGETKKHIKKELIDPIIAHANRHFFGAYSWDGMKESFAHEIASLVANFGERFATKIKHSFKSSSKAKGQQPRLLEEPYDPKNILFTHSKINEVTIRPSIGEKGTSITYIRRQVHPSYALFLCGIQSPESGADVGRYHQPTIYVTVSPCDMETPVRMLLNMANTNHPSPNPSLESGAISAPEEAVEEEQ